MKMAWDDERSRRFVSSIGIVSTKGPRGYNVMACEWTHHISYDPALISVSINPRHLSAENIKFSKEFGVSIASVSQATAASVSGNYSGRDVDKISALQDLGYQFYKAKNIDVLLLKGASLNAECKLREAIELGDHTMFVGEVVEAEAGEEPPLTYHNGSYWKLSEKLPKPSQELLEKIEEVVSKHRS